MKNGIYTATIAVAGSLALTAILQNSSVSDAIVEGALTGGSLWATATASVGNFGQSGLTVHQ
ncbi:MAG TPA: hypothetical protein VHL60_02685 [Oxalicibacterium sp.]|jgi:hypothetical protein|nr:hypothetical protein [Oxalicibacterium sp.]